MQIMMNSTEADALVNSLYAGESKPLSKNINRRDANSLNWWLLSSKTETVSHDRKRAAIQLYIELAARSAPSLPVGCFPASFDFSNGDRRRPGKGLIKALHNAGLIRGELRDENLIFQLTEEGRAKFGVAA